MVNSYRIFWDSVREVSVDLRPFGSSLTGGICYSNFYDGVGSISVDFRLDLLSSFQGEINVSFFLIGVTGGDKGVTTGFYIIVLLRGVITGYLL